MANVYQADLSSGKSFDVTTDQHHSNHTDETFKQHLLDVIKSSVSGIISGAVVTFAFKGRK